MGQWSLRLNKGNLRKPDQREKLQSDQSRLIIPDILKSSSWPATGPTLNFPTKFILMVIVWVSSANKYERNDTQQILHTDRFRFHHRLFFCSTSTLYVEVYMILIEKSKLWCYLLKYARIFLD